MNPYRDRIEEVCHATLCRSNDPGFSKGNISGPTTCDRCGVQRTPNAAPRAGRAYLGDYERPASEETPLPGGKVDVYIMPGYAVGRLGRPIVVLSPYKIPEEKFSAITYDLRASAPIMEKGD